MKALISTYDKQGITSLAQALVDAGFELVRTGGTHRELIASGLDVQCQNDRSQHKNKATAMKQIRAKLYEHEFKKKLDQAQAVEETKADIGWGSQIRSYVLDQSRVKDLRTQIESSNPEAILDGNINQFLEASLKQGV